LFDSNISVFRNQALIGASLFVVGVWLAYEAGGKILAGDTQTLLLAAMGLAGCGIALRMLRSWRAGFYMFFCWLMVEDLPRKYMGNNLALFFGKDILLALVYVALFREIRRGKEKAFRPPFLLFLSLFFWLAVLQVFNPNSPHVLYGLLGLKVYFYYVPLMFAGYALVRDEKSLRKFLLTNAAIALVIAGIGVIQVLGPRSFLNPAILAPELQDSGNLYKVTPISGQAFSLPASVFVSAGRFDEFLIVAFLIVLGTLAYLLLSQQQKWRNLVFAAIAVVAVASLLCGARSTVLFNSIGAAILLVGFLWGAPWRNRQVHRLVRAIRGSVLVAALGVTALLMIFPEQAGSRLSFYAETLSPSSSAYEGRNRTWDYPIRNLEAAFEHPTWIYGNGMGTATLGAQYVGRILGQRPPNISVEEGYGQMIVEMGILAPFLWIVWTAALLYYCWKIVRQLRQTRFFPIALAIFFYAFFLLYPITFGSMTAYENYICNAYLWLLVGVLFRLPSLAAAPAEPSPMQRVEAR
jgi:hypothetical protein